MPSVSKSNIFLDLLLFEHLYCKMEAYTPLVHLPAEETNYVPNKKFSSKDLPADCTPTTLTTRTSSLSFSE
jgi:hypothetical protein